MKDLPSGKVRQLVSSGRKLATLQSDVTIAEAAQTMARNNIGSLLVMNDQGKFAGIVTERDIVKKIAAVGLDPASVLLGQILTSEVVSCTMDTPISDVEEKMHWHKIRHMPVMENGEPVAILSSRDVIAYQIARSKDMKLAAEQVARMSVAIKSSDFDELAAWAATEVSRLFNARHAVLWIEPGDREAAFVGFAARDNCQCSPADVFTQIATCRECHGPSFIPLKEDSLCHKSAAGSHALVIPLRVSECAKEGMPGVNVKAGFLCICGMERNGLEADEVTLYKASLLSEILSANLTNARLYSEYNKAKSQSRTDPLTGLGTRRVFEHELGKEYERAMRSTEGFCIAVMDIDKFKLINDGLGHAVGDEVLGRVAKVLQNARRPGDIAVRYGGDEMVMLMPRTTCEQAVEVMEGVRAAVERESQATPPAATVSCGIAEWSGKGGESGDDVFKRADASLYEAKKSGRNRVCANAALFVF